MKSLFVIMLLLGVLSCSKGVDTQPVDEAPAPVPMATNHGDFQQAPTDVDLLVYKSASCGCCADWVAHMQEAGFTSKVEHPEDLVAVKQSWNISSEYQSCHTAVSRQGYIFEGHIPAYVIQRFLAEKPANAMGLAVAGMPIGSPGMEMGDKFEPYDVRLLRKDGKTELFTRITKPR